MPRLLVIALNQAATVLFGILGIRLVSYVVEERVFGAYGLYLTLTQIGFLLTHSGLINHASRYWQREQPNVHSYLRFLLQATWRKTLPLIALLLVVSVGMAVWQKSLVWIELLPLLLVSNLGIALSYLATLVLNAGERHGTLLVVNASASAARAVLPVGVALVFGATLFALSSGFALHAVAVVIFVLALFRRWGLSAAIEPALNTRWMQELRDFGRPFVWMGAGGWLLQYADRWTVAFYFGNHQAGVFNLASNIASMVPALVCGALMQRVFPAVFRAADHAQTEEDWRALARRCDRATLLFLLLTVAGLIALHFVGPYLVGWLVSARYAPCMPILLPAGMGAVAMQTNQFQYLLLQGQHDSSGMVRVMLILAGIRTVGTILAAAVSWPVLLGWLLVSSLIVAGLGRFLIQRTVLSNCRNPGANALVTSVRG